MFLNQASEQVEGKPARLRAVYLFPQIQQGECTCAQASLGARTPGFKGTLGVTKTFTNADWVLNQNKAIFRAFQWEIYGTRDNLTFVHKNLTFIWSKISATFSSCWNPWPTGQQIGAIPVEPTGQRFIRYQHLIKLFSVSQLKLKISYLLTLVYNILNKRSRQEKTQKLV